MNKDKEHIIEQLRDTIMFDIFTDNELQQLDSMTRMVTLKPDTVLFQQGQEFKQFYYTVSGTIKLVSVSEEGGENVVEIMQKGDYFAEALMFIKKPQYPVRAVAINTTSLIAIDAVKYRNLISQSNNAVFHLLGAYSMRIHQLVRQIDDMSLHSTKSRVAAYILRCCELHSKLVFSLDIPKNTIASRLSMKPETFSRALHFFEESGVLSINKRTIEVRDKKQLIDFINNDTKC